MLGVQHLQRDVLHQHWEALHTIVSHHQFSKTQATENSGGGVGVGGQYKDTKKLLKSFFLSLPLDLEVKSVGEQKHSFLDSKTSDKCLG